MRFVILWGKNFIITDTSQRCHAGLKILPRADRRIWEFKMKRLLYQWNPISNNLFYCHVPAILKEKLRKKKILYNLHRKQVISPPFCKRRDCFTHKSLVACYLQGKYHSILGSEEDRTQDNCSSIQLAVQPWASHFTSKGLAVSNSRPAYLLSLLWELNVCESILSNMN